MKTESAKKYNGWSNYETWNMNLWMDNDLNEYWFKEAEDAYAYAAPTSYSTRIQEATNNLANQIKDFYDEARPELPGVYGDLLGVALSAIDWYEIAEGLLDGIEKEEVK